MNVTPHNNVMLWLPVRTNTPSTIARRLRRRSAGAVNTAQIAATRNGIDETAMSSPKISAPRHIRDEVRARHQHCAGNL